MVRVSRLKCLSLSSDYTKIGLNQKAFEGDFLQLNLEVGNTVRVVLCRIESNSIVVRDCQTCKTYNILFSDIKSFDVLHRGDKSKGYFSCC